MRDASLKVGGKYLEVGDQRSEIRGQRSEVRDQRNDDGGQRTDDRWFKLLNIEQQNKEPQNDEVVTSIFDIPCSIFCGSK